MNSRKKGFTLIELIAVLVILAILALIVTPLVMNIIRKAKISADRRSVDSYGRSVELAIATHLLDTGTFPTDLKNLNVEYTGKTVSCNIMQMKENGGIYLSECSVGTKEVKDSSTEDGWYHYGTRDLTNEEYVDMYGLALKTASVAYYNTNGNPVEDYTTLTIEYTGKPVSCDVTVNYDGSIYMTKCKVNNVDVTDDTEDGYYHYGAITFKPYNIGDEVSYNNVNYYVIADSGASESTVTLLKAEPLTVSEVNTYGGVGTANNHVNMYNINSAYSYYRTAYDDGSTGYGGMAYYSSSTCGNGTYTGCTTDYGESEVKYVVDAWKTDKAPAATEARLITLNDLMELTDEVYYEDEETHEDPYFSLGYDWLRTDDEDNSYHVWTSTPYYSSGTFVWEVGPGESINTNGNLVQVWREYYMVRPVITISKTAISS